MVVTLTIIKNMLILFAYFIVMMLSNNRKPRSAINGYIAGYILKASINSPLKSKTAAL